MWYIKDQALESQSNLSEIKDLEVQYEEHRAHSLAFFACSQIETRKQL